MSKEKEATSGVDIFQLLEAASEEKRRKERRQILESLGVKEFFEEGSISIDMKTCRGVECRLCIEACPTHALYWRSGTLEVGENLCVYCTACVLSCIVDDCIRVRRKRPTGEVEEFSNPRQVFLLLQRIGSGMKTERVRSVLEWAREIPFPPRSRVLSSLVRLRRLRGS